MILLVGIFIKQNALWFSGMKVAGGADEAVTPYSFPFIFQAYPPTIKLFVVSPVDTSLLILEIR